MAALEDEKEIRSILEDNKQSHILQILDSYKTKEDSEKFLKHLKSLDLKKVFTIYKNTITNQTNEVEQKAKAALIEPVPSKNILTPNTVAGRKLLRKNGMEIIARNEVAVITLAGGQGSRLGFDGPKGQYNVGLTLNKSLFEMQADRIKKLSIESNAIITWLIMTSPLNHSATNSFFKKHDYFNLGKENVFLFEQGVLPCFDFNGKMILKASNEISSSPDGNGGVFLSLSRSGMVDVLSKRNIKYVNIVSIDNILTIPAEPMLIGAAILVNRFEVSNLTIKRVTWDEKLGTFVIKDSKFRGIEYSEIQENLAKLTDNEGNLKHRAGNTCNHLLSLDFIKERVIESSKGLNNLYHVATKKIPYFDFKNKNIVKPDENNGIKLELFMFDVFQICDPTQILCVELPREECFSPVKNAPGATNGTPEVAKQMFRDLCKTWLVDYGVKIIGQSYIEISPFVTINGNFDEFKELKKSDFVLNTPAVLITSKETIKYGLKSDEKKKILKNGVYFYIF